MPTELLTSISLPASKEDAKDLSPTHYLADTQNPASNLIWVDATSPTAVLPAASENDLIRNLTDAPVTISGVAIASGASFRATIDTAADVGTNWEEYFGSGGDGLKITPLPDPSIPLEMGNIYFGNVQDRIYTVATPKVGGPLGLSILNTNDVKSGKFFYYTSPIPVLRPDDGGDLTALPAISVSPSVRHDLVWMQGSNSFHLESPRSSHVPIDYTDNGVSLIIDTDYTVANGTNANTDLTVKVPAIPAGGLEIYYDPASTGPLRIEQLFLPGQDDTTPGAQVISRDGTVNWFTQIGLEHKGSWIRLHPTVSGFWAVDILKPFDPSQKDVPRGTTAEKLALGTVPFNTLFGDETLGQLQKFGPSGNTFNVLKGTTHQPGVMSWPTNTTEGSGLNFKVTEDPDATVGITSLNLPDGTQKQIWIVAQQVVGETPSVGGSGTLGTEATIRNDAGVISLVGVPNEIRWRNSGSWATLSYNQIANVVVDSMDITTANIQQILQSAGGTWQNLDGSSGVDAAAAWTTDTEYVGPDNKQFSLVVPATSANGPYVTNDGQTLTPGKLYNLKYNADRTASDSVAAIADDAATVAEFLLMELVGGVSGSGSVELISRSGSHNPGNGNPFQHSAQHGIEGSITYADGIYTIGISDIYDIDASLNIANRASAGFVQARVFINGIAEGPAAFISNDSTINFPGSGAVMIARPLVTGDTVEFRQLVSTGFNVTKNTSMRIATRGGPRGADGVDGTPGTPGIDGIDGANGAPGIDGISIDHISLTSGTSAPGTTDTYTAWGDVGETVNLGTFDVPIPAAIPGTPIRAESGTRLVQNGINPGANSGTVAFPEAFKAGTIPTVIAVPQAGGDNASVTLQNVTNTGFTSWIVRNESDVGVPYDLHWMAIGTAPN